MSPLLKITITATALGGALAVATAAPAVAETRPYQLPGVTSSNASCVGAALDFGAHYGVDGSTFPVVTHGEVGPAVSGHATTDGPGAVGSFNSQLAQNHGDIQQCLP
ncbi:MAG: hypothetical protein ABR571_10885 [Jatrophihabitans sp.]|uniref:hypothetical protein n=1 Tax=Jatrophihabitans sp. TaxID=1932789 RepID=UPI003910D350